MDWNWSRPSASPLLTRLGHECATQLRAKQDLSFDPPLKRIARLEAQVPVFMAMAREALKQRVANDRAAQIARVTRMQEEERAERGTSDMGPMVRRRRGEIEREERPDVDSPLEFKPTITGARRADPLRIFLGIRNLHRPTHGANADNARRWVAAQTYRNAIEIAGGARIGDRPMERVDRSNAMYGPHDTMLDCTRLVASARTKLGRNYAAVRWVVEEYCAIDEYAVVAGVSEGVAQDQLTAGLDGLRDCFDGYEGAAAA